MPSEMKEFFTAAKGLTPKAVCVGYAYKLFNGSNGILDALNSQYNKIYLSNDYHSFLKQQNIVFDVLVNLMLRKDLSFKNEFKWMKIKKTLMLTMLILKILNAKNN